MNVNYKKQFEKTLSEIKKSKTAPKLLLHSCCAPCSTAVIDVLKDVFDLTVFYYNPNIYPVDEYEKRLAEQKKLCKLWNVKMLQTEYVPEEFYLKVKGRESDFEGGARCKICCELRLRKTAEVASEKGFDYFCSTLSVSPLKNASYLNEIGERLEAELNVKYLVNDFKKNDGYLKSVRLSKELELYRQNYCGCEFSKNKVI